jgi:cell division protease FtsH
VDENEEKKSQKKPPNKRRIVLYVLLSVIILALILGQIVPKAQQKMQSGETVELTTSQFVTAVKQDMVKEVTYRAATAVLSGTYYKDEAAKKADKTTAFTSAYTGDDSLQELMQAHPDIKYDEDVTTSGWVSTLISTLLPILLFVGILIFFFSQMNGANNKQMQFGKAKIKKQGEDVPKVKFDDVAGIDEAVEELKEIKDFLANPAKYQAMGAKIPRGVLLVGPPGTGKTLLARAVAGEAGVPFFSISGSDFVEMFVGVGASRVRDLFSQAKESSPSIIFIDEIDAVGRQRGAGVGGGHDEREQTLNQLLVEMDGFDANDSVIMIAATNRVDILDPALLRPGRFDRQIVVDTPDLPGREKILKVHSKGKPLSSGVDLAAIAKMTVGFTGADLANLMNESALLAARREKSIITNAEVEESMERVIAGPERKGRMMTDAEKKCIAYHESGHALVGHLLEHADPIHKISIIARGQALGYTLSVPDEDRFLKSKNEMIDDLAMFLGGRVAEEVVIGDVTTGASNDLERATKMAKQMVTRYGMSDVLGHQVYGQANHEVFLGRDYGSTPDYSEQTASVIDSEVTRIMTDAHDTAYTILTENREQLDLMASVLLERETVEGEAVDALLNNKWQEYLEREAELNDEKAAKIAEEEKQAVLNAPKTEDNAAEKDGEAAASSKEEKAQN